MAVTRARALPSRTHAKREVECAALADQRGSDQAVNHCLDPQPLRSVGEMAFRDPAAANPRRDRRSQFGNQRTQPRKSSHTQVRLSTYYLSRAPTLQSARNSAQLVVNLRNRRNSREPDVRRTGGVMIHRLLEPAVRP
jgi:hypothetical protein